MFIFHSKYPRWVFFSNCDPLTVWCTFWWPLHSQKVVTRQMALKHAPFFVCKRPATMSHIIHSLRFRGKAYRWCRSWTIYIVTPPPLLHNGFLKLQINFTDIFPALFFILLVDVVPDSIKQHCGLFYTTQQHYTIPIYGEPENKIRKMLGLHNLAKKKSECETIMSL